MQNVTEVAVGLIALGYRTDAVGDTQIRRLHHEAWVGLGIDSVGGGPFVGMRLITWWKYHEIENESVRFDAFNLIPADTIYWDVQPGGEIFIEVDW